MVISRNNTGNRLSRPMSRRRTLKRCSTLITLSRTVHIPGLRYKRLVIDGKITWALIDNQSKTNTITLEYARMRKLVINSKRTAYMMADGNLHTSLGHVWMHCGCVSKRQTWKARRFEVFPDGISAVAVGENFLSEVGMLKSMEESTEHASSGSEVADAHPEINNASPHSYSLSCVHASLENDFGNRRVLVILDLCSNENIISLECARSLGFTSLASRPSSMQMGSGRKVRCEGRFQATIDLGIPIHQANQAYFVVKDLPYDMALGGPFIARNSLLGRNQIALKWTSRRLTHPFCFASSSGYDPTGLIKENSDAEKRLRKQTADIKYQTEMMTERMQTIEAEIERQNHILIEKRKAYEAERAKIRARQIQSRRISAAEEELGEMSLEEKKMKIRRGLAKGPTEPKQQRQPESSTSKQPSSEGTSEASKSPINKPEDSVTPQIEGDTRTSEDAGTQTVEASTRPQPGISTSNSPAIPPPSSKAEGALPDNPAKLLPPNLSTEVTSSSNSIDPKSTIPLNNPTNSTTSSVPFEPTPLIKRAFRGVFKTIRHRSEDGSSTPLRGTMESGNPFKNPENTEVGRNSKQVGE